MRGQWLGTADASSDTELILNVDQHEGSFAGTVHVTDRADPGIPPLQGWFDLGKTGFPATTRFEFVALDMAAGGRGLSQREAAERFPGVSIPRFADVSFELSDHVLKAAWKTDSDESDTATLKSADPQAPSELQPLVTSWEDFKRHVGKFKPRRFLFRGQSSGWRLRTTFHRRGRYDLVRYLHDDLPALHRHLSGRTNHHYNANDPDERGTFLNLVQHHGYPTPLLDWTWSPYVAAFFAFNGVSKAEAKAADDVDRVRILVLDALAWSLLPSIKLLAHPWLHLSIMEFPAIDNPRLIPQQAVSTLTNVDDIESYIGKLEVIRKTRYLHAIEIKKAERTSVLSELAYMGLTTGSLFPGLDGACRDLAERNFE